MRAGWIAGVLLLSACGSSDPLGGSSDRGDWLDEPLPLPPLTAPAGEWLSTDSHVHSDHSSDGSIWRQASSDALPGNVSVADQIGQGENRGLAFMAITDHRTYDQHWDPLWSSDRLLLIPGEEANGRPHANIFGAVDTVLDGRDGAGESEHRPTQQSIWDAHAQAAVWQTNHPNRDSMNDDGSANAHGSALGGNLIEVWNIAEDIDLQLAYAESRWNLGFESGLTASSDNHFRELWYIGLGPGSVKTHVFAPARNERAILDALSRGRTVLTRGGDSEAMLTIEADAQGDGVYEAIAGDWIPVAPNQSLTLRLRAQRASGQTISLYAKPGRDAGAIAEFHPTLADESFTFTLTAPAEQYWVYAELSDWRGRSALTSPLFLRPFTPVPAGELAVPTDRGQPDAAAKLFGQRGSFTGFPDAAQSRDGKLIVVAEQHGEKGTDVVFRRDGDATQVLNTVAGAARFPRVAAQGPQLWAVWEDERDGQQPRYPRIVLRGSQDGGVSWGSEQRLAGGASRAIRPAIAVLPDGRPVIAWSDNARRCFDLYVQVGIDGEPQNLTAEKACSGGSILDTRSTRDPASLHPALTVLADGSVVVMYQDNRYDINPGWSGQTGFSGGFEGIDRTDPDNWEILAQRLDPAGGAWSAPVRVSNNGGDNSDETALADRHPTLAADAQDRLVAAWDSKVLSAAGVNSAIMAAHSIDGGRSWSAPELVGLETEAMSQRPAAATDASGTVRLAWMDTRDGDWRHRIWSSRWSATTGWSAAERLSGAGNAGFPRLVHDRVVFASDRGADLQRDPTWRVLSRGLSPVALAELPAAKHGSTTQAPLSEIAPGQYRRLASALATRGRAAASLELRSRPLIYPSGDHGAAPDRPSSPGHGPAVTAQYAGPQTQGVR